MIKKENRFLIIVKILGAIAFIFYALFLIFEDIPLTNQASLGGISVYLLFALFVVGYYFLWQNEFISGIIFMVWYVLEWILVFWVWIDGGLTLFLGFPIFLLGLFITISEVRKNKVKSGK